MVAGKGTRRRNLVPSTSHTIPKDFPESQKPQTLWRILPLAKQRGTNSVRNDELQMVNNNQPETTSIPTEPTKAEYVMGVKGRSSRRS
ncbi:hypothetical protein SDJN03_25879, partial [Cucurbita argyrosperma subsp. sororia]